MKTELANYLNAETEKLKEQQRMNKPDTKYVTVTFHCETEARQRALFNRTLCEPMTIIVGNETIIKTDRINVWETTYQKEPVVKVIGCIQGSEAAELAKLS